MNYNALSGELRNTRLDETKETFHEPQWYFEKRGYHVRIRADAVKKFSGDLRIERILDIGCGDGSISLPLLNKSRHLTLLDMSEGMLARARFRVPPDLAARVKIVNSDFMRAPLETGSYDLIICLGVLAYVDSLPLFLEKLTSLLAPGGSVIIEWTDGRHFINRLVRPVQKLAGALTRSNGNYYLPGTLEVIEQFQNRGFEASASYRYCPPLPIMRRLLSQGLSYHLIRIIHGKVEKNRASWLGDECIYHFREIRCTVHKRSLPRP